MPSKLANKKKTTGEAGLDTVKPLINGAAPSFKIFTGALKAFTKDDGRKYLSCTASSNIEDLHGDTITAECVQSMAPQAKRKSMTIFLNHSYDVPEDVFGSTVDASIVQRATEKDGTPIYDLDLEIALNEANPRAIETYAAIKDQEVKLGVSIGANIEDFEFKDKDAGWWGGLIINAVNLLEASIVGIPANPRSWVQNAVRAIKSMVPVEELNAPPVKDVEPDTKKATVWVTDDEGNEVVVQTGEAKDAATGDPAKVADVEANTPDTTAEAVAPAGETASDAPVEEPTSTVDLAAIVESVKALEPSTLASIIPMVLEALESAATQIAELKTQKDKADADFAAAAAIVETIASLPLGRKTQFAGQVDAFRAKFSGMYGEGLLALLDERKNS